MLGLVARAIGGIASGFSGAAAAATGEVGTSISLGAGRSAISGGGVAAAGEALGAHVGKSFSGGATFMEGAGHLAGRSLVFNTAMDGISSFSNLGSAQGPLGSSGGGLGGNDWSTDSAGTGFGRSERSAGKNGPDGVGGQGGGSKGEIPEGPSIRSAVGGVSDDIAGLVAILNGFTTTAYMKDFRAQGSMPPGFVKEVGWLLVRTVYKGACRLVTPTDIKYWGYQAEKQRLLVWAMEEFHGSEWQALNSEIEMLEHTI